MKQLLVDFDPVEGKQFILSSSKAHYLMKVRRLRDGDSVDLLCNNQQTAKAILCSNKNDPAALHIIKIDSIKKGTSQSPHQTHSIELCLAYLKGKKLDTVIRQSVECGVTHFSIIKTHNTVFDLPKERILKRITRWETIAKEACQQSGNNSQIQVAYYSDLSKFIEKSKREGFFLHEIPINSHSLHESIQFIKNIKKLSLFIGPEGGFSPKELDLFGRKGYYPVWMGPTVMRAETAAIAAVSVINNLIMEQNRWCLAKKKK